MASSRQRVETTAHSMHQTPVNTWRVPFPHRHKSGHIFTASLSRLFGHYCVVRMQYVRFDVDELRFEWDPAKARLNRRKHGVAFEEAQTVFADEDAVLVADPVHSASEDRFYLLGLSARLRVLVVVHCYRVDDELVRLISARKARSSERAQYDARWKR